MRIDPPDSWSGPALRRLIDALTAAGGSARLVGGSVRDAMLGLSAQDIDIATTLRPEQVKPALAAAGVKAVPTGVEHGTYTAVANGHVFEVTTLRCDVATDGRRATVEFTEDWEKDAARRDLTFNALFADLDGRIYDLVGGVSDLRQGRVRFVGDPAQRIVEDYLRIPRYFRFYARFGKQTPDGATLAAMRKNISGVDQLSGERLRRELVSLLSLADPMAGVDLATEVGFWARLWTNPTERAPLTRLIAIESALGLPPDPIRRLAALAGAGVSLALAERLRLSKNEAKRLLAIQDALPLIANANPAASQALRRKLGSVAVRDAALIAASDAEVAVWVAATAQETPHPPVTAKDLLALGMTPGPTLGRVLAALEEWWDAAEGAPDRDACLAKATEIAPGS